MAAADQEVYRRAANVQADGAELLDGVHDQHQVATAGQLAEGGQVGTETVVPLDAAQQDHPRMAIDRWREVLGQEPAFAAGDDL